MAPVDPAIPYPARAAEASGCPAVPGIGLALALPYPTTATLGYVVAGTNMANVGRRY